MDDFQPRQLDLQITCDGAAHEALASPRRQPLSLLPGAEVACAGLLPGGPIAVQAWIAGSSEQPQELLKMYARGRTRK